jgi:hypothetical protein
MRAPSEKHLEDYLVSVWDTDIIQRQAKLPHGIADLILRFGHFLAVAELKKGPIEAEAVIQLLRYMSDMRRIFNYTRYRWYTERKQFYKGRSNIGNSGPEELLGVIIGHELPDHKVMHVCEMSQILVMTYEYDGQRYRLINHAPRESASFSEEMELRDLAAGPIGDAFLEIMTEYNARRSWPEVG